jgi:hypothetical protein
MEPLIVTIFRSFLHELAGQGFPLAALLWSLYFLGVDAGSNAAGLYSVCCWYTAVCSVGFVLAQRRSICGSDRWAVVTEGSSVALEQNGDRWAIVTGASKGMGREMARELFVRHGYSVAIVARSQKLQKGG